MQQEDSNDIGECFVFCSHDKPLNAVVCLANRLSGFGITHSCERIIAMGDAPDLCHPDRLSYWLNRVASLQVNFKLVTHFAWRRNFTFSEPVEGESSFELTSTLFFNRKGDVCGYEIEAPSFDAMWGIVDPLRQAGFPSREVR